ncbi:MAG TPA: alpha/beta hydrolase-fold protein [Edaphobacter sp.]|nr:alpha/beta hydrolase-fold protein [Edaphobacter sp.]
MRTQEIVKQNLSVTVSDVRVWSHGIHAMLWYRIIVPAHDSSELLPVLYLLHGANSGPVDIVERSNVLSLAEKYRLIVVMPEAGYSYYTNAQHLKNARWEDVTIDDLSRDVLANFPVKQRPRSAGIAGISMGGYGAAKLALKYPEKFSFVGVMSGSLDITRRSPSIQRWSQTERIWAIFGYLNRTRRKEDVFELLTPQTYPAVNFHWFNSCGEEDPLRPVNSRFVKALNEHGAASQMLLTAGGHDWQSWNIALPMMFEAASETISP